MRAEKPDGTGPVAEDRGRTTRRRLAGALLLILATLGAYLPALGGGFIWDDDQHVTDNPCLRDLEGLGEIWTDPSATPQYYPLVHTTFWLEYRLWQDLPFGYHLVNVILHGLAALLLWRLLASLGVPGAWLAGAIFALHPVHVESVAWISERKNVLSAVMYLVAMLGLTRFSGLACERSRGRRRWLLYALGSAAFVLALLAKTVTATLPAALLLLVWWKRGRLTAADVIPMAPLAALAVVAGLTTIWLEVEHVGAAGQDWSLGFVDRCLLAGRALFFYASKLIWPRPLIFFYPRWVVDATVWWQYLFPLSAAAVVGLLWRARERLGRGPLTATLFFAGTLFPALGFFDVYPMRFSWVADHFQYLASAGLISLAAGVAVTWWSRWPVGARRVGILGVISWLLALGWLTWDRALVYRDAKGLWQDTVTANPDAWLAHHNLGWIHAREGDTAAALKSYGRSLILRDDYALTHTNLGTELLKVGRIEEAVLHHRRALDLYPGLAAANNNLAVTLMERARREALSGEMSAAEISLAEAEQRLRNAVGIKPDYAEAVYNLGSVLAFSGKSEEADRLLLLAYDLDPDLWEALNKLGHLWMLQGRYGEAADLFRKALTKAPLSEDLQARLAEAERLESAAY